MPGGLPFLFTTRLLDGTASAGDFCASAFTMGRDGARGSDDDGTELEVGEFLFASDFDVAFSLRLALRTLPNEAAGARSDKLSCVALGVSDSPCDPELDPVPDCEDAT